MVYDKLKRKLKSGFKSEDDIEYRLFMTKDEKKGLKAVYNKLKSISEKDPVAKEVLDLYDKGKIFPNDLSNYFFLKKAGSEGDEEANRSIEAYNKGDRNFNNFLKIRVEYTKLKNKAKGGDDIAKEAVDLLNEGKIYGDEAKTYVKLKNEAKDGDVGAKEALDLYDKGKFDIFSADDYAKLKNKAEDGDVGAKEALDLWGKDVFVKGYQATKYSELKNMANKGDDLAKETIEKFKNGEFGDTVGSVNYAMYHYITRKKKEK